MQYERKYLEQIQAIFGIQKLCREKEDDLIQIINKVYEDWIEDWRYEMKEEMDSE